MQPSLLAFMNAGRRISPTAGADELPRIDEPVLNATKHGRASPMLDCKTSPSRPALEEGAPIAVD